MLESYTYEYRIYPNQEQRLFFEKTFGCCRVVYNYFLNREKNHYLENKEDIEKKRVKSHNTSYDNQKLLTKLKREESYKWLNEVYSHTLQRELVNLETAYKKFFKKQGGFPRFKKKGFEDSFGLDNIGFRLKEGKLHLAKLKRPVKVKLHRPLEGKIVCATVSKTASGKYFISIAVEREIKHLEPVEEKIGGDLGVKDFAVLSNGEKIPNPKIKRSQRKKLEYLHRQLSKKRKGSKNKNKTRKKLGGKYEKVKNQVRDFLQKLSTRLISENQVICLEDLNVKGMVKNHKLADAIHEASWSKFVSMLKYKAKWYGRTIVQVDRFFPSSKTCYECGYVNQKLTLDDREWTCPECGTHHDRDFNAANNILRQGLHLLNEESRRLERPSKACGAARVAESVEAGSRSVFS